MILIIQRNVIGWLQWNILPDSITSAWRFFKAQPLLKAKLITPFIVALISFRLRRTSSTLKAVI